MNPYTLALSLALLTPSLSYAATEDQRYMKDGRAPVSYHQETQTYTLSCDLSGFDGNLMSYDASHYCLEYKKYQADMITEEYVEAVKKNYQDRPDLLNLFNEELSAWYDYEERVAINTQKFYADASGPGQITALRSSSLALKKVLIHNIWLFWLAPQLMPEPIIQEAPHQASTTSFGRRPKVSVNTLAKCLASR